MQKKNINFLRKIRLLVPAQNASISPPIGPILGQFGINIMDFCKQFNEVSKYLDLNVLVLVIVFLLKNKNFSFKIKTPPFSFLINEENFDLLDEEISIYVNISTIYKILLLKKKYFFFDVSDIKLFKILFGSIRSMHLQICNDILQ